MVLSYGNRPRLGLYWLKRSRPSTIDGASPLQTSLQGDLRKYYPAYAVVFAVSFFSHVLSLAPSIYLLQVHERVYASRNVLTLSFLTVIVVVLLGTWAVLMWVRSEICARAAAGYVDAIEERVFRASQRRQSGVSTARFVGDLQAIREVMGGPFLPALVDIILSPIFILVLFLLHPAFGFLGIGLTATLAGLSLLNRRISQVPSRKSHEAQGSAIEFSANLSRNTEAARAMGMIPGLTRLWKDRQDLARGWQAKATGRTTPILTVARFLRNGQIVLVTFVGAHLYINGSISSGTAFAALMILTRSIGPIETVIVGWRGFSNARDSFERLNALLEEDSNAEDRVPLPRPEGRLAASHVSVSAPGGKQSIVRDVSFELEAGKIMAIVGPSGAGKSTLLRALANVWTPTSGAVTLDGHPYQHWAPDALGRYLGYLPQETELLPGSVAQNISRFYPDRPPDDPDLFAAVELAGVEDLIKSLPEGYNTIVGPSGFQLSGGQRQRLAFARAVYGGPSLILLDEPYSALDAKGEAHLVQSLARLAHYGTTVVLVTHKLNMLTHCDSVLVMHSGHIQAYGAREAILQRLPQTLSPLRVVGNT